VLRLLVLPHVGAPQPPKGELIVAEVLGDDGFGEGAAQSEFGFEGDGVDDEDRGFDLVADDDVVVSFVAHWEGDVVGCATGVDVVEFFEGFAFWLEVDVEREALVLGVVGMGVFEAEEASRPPSPQRGDFGDFGAAGAEELEDGVGFYFSVLIGVGVEAEGGFVTGVDLGSPPAPRGGGLLGFDAGGGEERE